MLFRSLAGEVLGQGLGVSLGVWAVELQLEFHVSHARLFVLQANRRETAHQARAIQASSLDGP